MTALTSLVAEELARPVDPRVTAMAKSLAAHYPKAARAVLFYGSCLRESQLDGLMLDFYLIVSDYAAAYGKSWLRRANTLLPPNVFPFEHDGLMAKYAVLSESDFACLNSTKADNVSVWARFAQPSRLVWTADRIAGEQATETIAQAPITLFAHTLPMMDQRHPLEPLGIWRAGFGLTYGAELRAERKGRSDNVVDHAPDYYERIGNAVLAGDLPSIDSAPKRWARLRRRGKWLTIARLAKATGTYAGGIDYLAWKINRHAGTSIEITPWQRRHPILAGIALLPKLVTSGAVK